MAEDRQASPEKQLLKLIEESKGAKPAGPGPARLKGKGFSLPSLGSLRGAILGRLSFMKRRTEKKVGAVSKFSLNLGALNRMLTITVVALFVYVVTDTVAQAIHLNTVPNFELPKDASAEYPVENITPLRDQGHYLGKVNSRNIFKEGKAPVEDKTVKKAIAPAETSETAKRYSLVGIAWSSNPDVIIEDKLKKRTYFAKKGQLITDDVRVEAVFKDKVVISTGGQEYELK